jgi:hypothetical protein
MHSRVNQFQAERVYSESPLWHLEAFDTMVQLMRAPQRFYRKTMKVALCSHNKLGLGIKSNVKVVAPL